jgi:hypothetical protein
LCKAEYFCQHYKNPAKCDIPKADFMVVASLVLHWGSNHNFNFYCKHGHFTVCFKTIFIMNPGVVYSSHGKIKIYKVSLKDFPKAIAAHVQKETIFWTQPETHVKVYSKIVWSPL